MTGHGELGVLIGDAERDQVMVEEEELSNKGIRERAILGENQVKPFDE